MTLWLIMRYHHTGFGYNLGCDTDLKYSNPIFSLGTSLLMMIYHQIEFGCKRLTGLELIKDIAETVIF